MRSLGMTATAVGVAEAYRDFLDVLVIDEEDGDLAAEVEEYRRACGRGADDYARAGGEARAGRSGAGRGSMTPCARH